LQRPATKVQLQARNPQQGIQARPGKRKGCGTLCYDNGTERAERFTTGKIIDQVRGCVTHHRWRRRSGRHAAFPSDLVFALALLSRCSFSESIRSISRMSSIRRSGSRSPAASWQSFCHCSNRSPCMTISAKQVTNSTTLTLTFSMRVVTLCLPVAI
jgi:hypothetical protein